MTYLLAFVLSWYIRDFSVSSELRPDGVLKVVEKIEVDFGNEHHHGIYRRIPVRFRGHPIDFKLISASNPTGVGRKYTVSRGSHYVTVKIGDKNVYLSGVQRYEIVYRVRYVVFDSAGVQWFIWNVTGNEWDVPIEHARFSVVFDSLPAPLKQACFTGSYGSTENACSAQCGANACFFSTTSPLQPYEGFTVLLQFPPGSVAQPGLMTRILWMFRLLWPLAIPLFAFGFMFNRWLKYGRDPKIGPITPMYEPPEGLLPIEAGSIIDEKMDPRDLTAEIIDLALRGYIEIIESPDKKDYVLVKLKDATQDMDPVDSYLLYALFSVGSIKGYLRKIRKKAQKDPEFARFLEKITRHMEQGRDVIALSSLERKFYKKFTTIKKKVMKQLTKKGYFVENPATVRAKYMSIGFLIPFVGFFALSFLIHDPVQSLIAIFSTALAGVIVAIFGSIMPRKTEKGARARWHLLGLKEFIKRVEEDRLRRFAIEHMDMFKKVLPYAIIFKQEKKWAKIFNEIYNRLQERGAVTTLHVTNFHVAVSHMGHAVGTTPSGGHGGGSGGFSGGGAGGGGGGAW